MVGNFSYFLMKFDLETDETKDSRFDKNPGHLNHHHDTRHASNQALNEAHLVVQNRWESQIDGEDLAGVRLFHACHHGPDLGRELAPIAELACATGQVRRHDSGADELLC